MGGVLFRGRCIEGVWSCCHRPCPWWRGFQRQAGLPVHWPYSTKKWRLNGPARKIEYFFCGGTKKPRQQECLSSGRRWWDWRKNTLGEYAEWFGSCPNRSVSWEASRYYICSVCIEPATGYTNGYRTIWGIISQVSLGRVPLTWCPICYCHKGNRHARQVLRQCTQCRLSKCSLGEIWKIGPYSLLT